VNVAYGTPWRRRTTTPRCARGNAAPKSKMSGCLSRTSFDKAVVTAGVGSSVRDGQRITRAGYVASNSPAASCGHEDVTIVTSSAAKRRMNLGNVPIHAADLRREIVGDHQNLHPEDVILVARMLRTLTRRSTLVRGGTWGLRFVPAPVATALGLMVADICWLLLRSRRRVLLENLRYTAPGLTPSDHRRLARSTMRNLARCTIDFLRIPLLTHDQFMQLVELRGVEHLDRAFAGGKGAILLTAHVGNWELAGAYLAARGYRGHAVAEDETIDADTYRIYERYRGATGMDLLPLSQAAAAGRLTLSRGAWPGAARRSRDGPRVPDGAFLRRLPSDSAWSGRRRAPIGRTAGGPFADAQSWRSPSLHHGDRAAAGSAHRSRGWVAAHRHNRTTYLDGRRPPPGPVVRLSARMDGRRVVDGRRRRYVISIIDDWICFACARCATNPRRTLIGRYNPRNHQRLGGFRGLRRDSPSTSRGNPAEAGSHDGCGHDGCGHDGCGHDRCGHDRCGVRL